MAYERATSSLAASLDRISLLVRLPVDRLDVLPSLFFERCQVTADVRVVGVAASDLIDEAPIDFVQTDRRLLRRESGGS